MKKSKNEVSKRKPDGTFMKGSGNHGNGRKFGLVEKGKKGFQPTPVILIRPDGHTIRMPSVVAAQKFLGLKNRDMISRAIRKGYAKRGYRLMYEKDFSPIGDYSFRLSTFRDEEGRATPALLRFRRMIQEKNMTPEQKRKRTERCRRQSLKMAADPNCRWGKGCKLHPIHCETNGKDYTSIKEASADLGIPSNQISLAIKRRGAAHGYKFYDKAVWDKVNERLSVLLRKEEKIV